MTDDIRKRPMRIAAGGLLALASLFTLFVALGFVVGGVFATQLGGVVGEGGFGASNSALVDGVGGPGVMGQILLVCAGIIFIGAVSVLASQYPKVIFVSCAVAILASLIGAVITSFGLPNAVGIVGGGLGFISGLRIQMTASQSTESSVQPRNLWDWLAVGCVVAGLALILIAAYVFFN